MARADAHSRLVGWLKILLPLLALGLLSTLFLVARTIDPAQNLPFADVDVDELAREQRIGGPRFSGVTRDGAAITLSAFSARPDPDNPQVLTGTGIDAGIVLPDGREVSVTAAAMRVDNAAALATLSDRVRVTTTDGFDIRSASVSMALDATRVWSEVPVTLTAPFGSMEAGSFELAEAAPGRYVFVFRNKVKLIYRPNQ